MAKVAVYRLFWPSTDYFKGIISLLKKDSLCHPSARSYSPSGDYPAYPLSLAIKKKNQKKIRKINKNNKKLKCNQREKADRDFLF